MALGLGLGFGLAASRSVSSPQTIDLFIIVGQSNADGRGDYTLAPASPNGISIISGTITDPLVDPLGATSHGDMWAAFSNQWYARTARKSAYVPAAVGDTALLAAADSGAGNWSPTGALRDAAVVEANAAIAAINAAADYSLGVVRFIFCQGERDAESNNGTTITAALYEQALEDLAAYFKAQVPEMLEMLVVQLGNDGVTASRDAQYALYRQAQANACADSDLLRMVCTAGMSFSYRTPQWKEDGLHYDQAALNQIGSMAAYETASPDTSEFTPNPVASANNYSGAVVGSRTIAHTCGASTKSIIVTVAAVRSGSTTLTSTVTFGGKSFREVKRAGSNWATLPASSAHASIWILDEDDYAASLAGASGNVIVTFSSSTAVLSSVVVIDSDEPLVIGSNDFVNDSDGTVSSVATAKNYANSPALMVSVVSGRIDSATPPTFTFSRGTEAADYGYNLDTRSYAAAAAYEVLAAPVYGATVTATPSATMVHAGLATATFRRRFNGETDVA